MATAVVRRTPRAGARVPSLVAHGRTACVQFFVLDGVAPKAGPKRAEAQSAINRELPGSLRRISLDLTFVMTVRVPRPEPSGRPRL